VVVFDRHESTEVHDVDTVTSRLAFPKATVGYCAVRFTGADTIMVTVLKTTRCYAQSWRDARDALPPHAGFTNLLTHVN
jgi:hypothetical protein